MIDSKTQGPLDITRTNRIETLWYDNDCIECEYVDPYSLDFESCLQSDDFSIMQFNIRGLVSKEEQLNRLLNKIGGENKVSVVALNETWLRKENINKVSFPGYNLEHKICKGKKGGGVSIAINKSLKYRRRLDHESSLDTIEHVWIELKTNAESVLICCAYRPPNMNAKQFCEEYESLRQVQKKLNKEIIIALDSNLDLLKSSSHTCTQSFLVFNTSCDIYPCITKPTHVSHTSATLIDNICCSEKIHRNNCSYILVDDISDHYPCLSILSELKDIMKIEKIYYTRSINDDKIKLIRERLAQENWHEKLSSLNCNDAFTLFHNCLIEHIEIICPERIKLKDKRKGNDPWITKGILRSIAKQKRLYKESMQNVATGKTVEYKLYKAKLQSIICRNKQNYLTGKCKEFRDNIKKMWQLINSVVRKEHNKLHTIDSLSKDGLLLTEQHDIANEFAKYFATVGSTCAQQIGPSKLGIDLYMSKIPRESSSIFLAPTTRHEIKRIIKSLKPKQSSGHDGFSNKLIKDLLDEIASPLCLIFNKSLEEGVFPACMKMADVTPLFKSKDRTNKTNYRPISLLLTISKVLEKNHV